VKYRVHLTGAGLAALLLLLPGPEKADLKAKVTQSAESEPQVMLHLGWGPGPTEAGRRMDPESAPEGPMSFHVTAGGDIFILDQVNLRILKCDDSGGLVSTIPLSGDTFQDMAVAQDGRIVLLDRLARAEVVVLDAGGRETASYPVTGQGIAEGGGITAMFLDGDGLWLEYNHERIVRILDGTLHACSRTVLKGRKAGSAGRMVSAALAGQGRVGLEVTDTTSGTTLAESEIDFGSDLYRIAWVQADAKGSLHAMVHLVTGHSVPAEKVLALRLDGNLKQTGSFESPCTIRPWEQFREFQVLPDGRVFQMAFLDSGVAVLKWRYLP
jgi:hypothetical protein